MNMQIRNLRVGQGMTQHKLANELKLKSKSTVSMWENGERTPSASMLPRIAAALNCTINDLFSDTGEHSETNRLESKKGDN